MAERAKCEICNRDFPNQDALAMHNSAKHNSEDKNPKKKSKIFYIILIIAILITGFVFLSYRNNFIAGNTITPIENTQPIKTNQNQQTQKLTLSFKNYNYYPNTITVKQGIPVEITLDNSIKGCYRSFNIRGLGVSKYSSSPSDTITFTPDKKGSFEFACGMHMGTGTIIVE